MMKMVMRCGAATLAIAAGTSTAIAQDSSGQSENSAAENAAPRPGIAEIVVTATRRDSDLQKTPIAVSAIDQQLIQQANVDNIGGLASFVPNFSAETIT